MLLKCNIMDVMQACLRKHSYTDPRWNQNYLCDRTESSHSSLHHRVIYSNLLSFIEFWPIGVAPHIYVKLTVIPYTLVCPLFLFFFKFLPFMHRSQLLTNFDTWWLIQCGYVSGCSLRRLKFYFDDFPFRPTRWPWTFLIV
jgi:hypothetical protein